MKVINEEITDLQKFGLDNYLQTQTDKFFYINTFLFRGVKKRLFDIYFPVKAIHGKLITDFTNLKELFDEYQYISIIGSAGSGKSTLTKFIFVSSIFQNFKIPVYIEFRGIHEDLSIENHIIQKLIGSDAKSSNSILTPRISTSS